MKIVFGSTFKPYTNDILSLTPLPFTHPNEYISKNGLICAVNDSDAWDVNFSFSAILAVPSIPSIIETSVFVFGSLKLAPTRVFMRRSSLEVRAKASISAAKFTFGLTLCRSIEEAKQNAEVEKIQRGLRGHRHDGLAKLVVVAAREREVHLLVREGVVVALR